MSDVVVRAGELTEQQKLDFLEYVRQGYIRPEAAAMVGSTGSQFARITKPGNFYYDEKFAGIYNQIMETREHEENRLERLRAAALKRAMLDSDRLLEKLLLIYDPDWAPLRTQRVELNANVDSFIHQHFSHLSAEQMRQLLEWMESNPDSNIIEQVDEALASVKELEPGE